MPSQQAAFLETASEAAAETTLVTKGTRKRKWDGVRRVKTTLSRVAGSGHHTQTKVVTDGAFTEIIQSRGRGQVMFTQRGQGAGRRREPRSRTLGRRRLECPGRQQAAAQGREPSCWSGLALQKSPAVPVTPLLDSPNTGDGPGIVCTEQCSGAPLGSLSWDGRVFH